MAAVTFSHFGCTLMLRARCWKSATSIAQYARVSSASSQRLRSLSTPRVLSPEVSAVDTSLTCSVSTGKGSLSPEFLANIRVNEEQGLPEVIETRNVPVYHRLLCSIVLSSECVQPTEALTFKDLLVHAGIFDSKMCDILVACLPLQVLLYAKRSEVETDAIQQLVALAESPLPVGYVAAMPDVHVGKGVTVCSTNCQALIISMLM